MTAASPELSVVVPVYDERDNLPLLVAEIAAALAGGRGGGGGYEIVAVDDGSSDGSLDVLKALKRDHPELHIVALAAHAGQTAAFAAGFRAARGRVIVTLDADLQNDPADITVLLDHLAASGATAAELDRERGPQPVERRNDPGYGVFAQSVPRGCGAGPAAVQRHAPLLPDPDQAVWRYGSRGARAAPAPPLRDDEVRHVEPRVAVVRGRLGGALDAATGVALSGLGGVTLR